MAEDVEIVIKGRDESKPAFEQAKFSEDQLKVSTKSLGDEFTQTGIKQSVSRQILKDLVGGYQNADSIIMGFSNHIEQSGSFSEYLDVQLGKLKSDAKLLGDEFNRTGSIDIFGKLRENQSATKSLESLKKDLAKAIDDGADQGGEQGGSSFLSKFTGMLSGAGPSMGEALGYSMAAIAPLLGGILAAGILAGIATGGIATGIVGQLHDPAVQSAATSAGHDIMSALTADTAPFKQPIIDALGTISGAISSTLGTIDFKTLASEVKPLADGIAGLIQQLGPGLNDAIAGSKPVMDALGQALPLIGKSISDVLSQVAAVGPQASEALRTLVLILGGAIEIVGGTVRALATLYGWIVDIVSAAHNLGSALTDWIPGLKSVNDEISTWVDYIKTGNQGTQEFGRSLTAAGGNAALTADDFATLNQQLSQVTQNADTTAGAMSDKLFTALMDSDQATLKVQESLTNLTDTLKQNKDALDIHSKAGQKDREAILQAVQANIKMYDTMIQTGSSAQDAAKAYDQNTQALVKQMRQAGLTQSQIDGLIGKYKNVPDTVNTNIVIQGLADAITNLNETLRLINGLHDKTVTLTIQGHVYGDISPQTLAHGLATGGTKGAATGATSSGWTWVGEHGPELLNLPAGTQVRSNPDSMAAVSQGGSGGGGTAEASVRFDGNLDSAMANAFKYLFYQGKIKLSVNGVVARIA